MENHVGEIKYFPSEFKEWNNNIYCFNSNSIKNLPLYNLNLNNLLRNYFDLYLNRKIIRSKLLYFKKRRTSLNKIFISKANLKHTNSKAIVTIYTYNREKIVLLKKLKKLKRFFFILEKFFFKYKNIYNKHLKYKFKKELIYIKRCKLKLNLNELKYKKSLLFKLSKLINKFYNQKVEFNIINLKAISYNPDIFITILKMKLKKKTGNILKIMKTFLNKSIILEEETNLKKLGGKQKKTVDFNLVNNKYKNSSLNSIVEDINLNESIKDLYSVEKEDNNDIIFNSIKYKNIRGIRLELKGRLTKRKRADRAMFKIKWKGGLKNIDSCYRGLSSVNYRGNINSNLEYSIGISKRPVGAFAVKGWISGKS